MLSKECEYWMNVQTTVLKQASGRNKCQNLEIVDFGAHGDELNKPTPSPLRIMRLPRIGRLTVELKGARSLALRLGLEN